jgi:hypothetical protein
LVYLTEGPTSPFFVLFTFAIISGALLWGGAGAAGTAAILLLVFVLATTLDAVTAAEDLNRTIVRFVYLVVVAVLIGYFGWHRQRAVERLKRLAAWPPASAPQGTTPALANSLQHAAIVLGVARVLVVWEEQSRSGWLVARAF